MFQHNYNLNWWLLDYGDMFEINVLLYKAINHVSSWLLGEEVVGTVNSQQDGPGFEPCRDQRTFCVFGVCMFSPYLYEFSLDRRSYFLQL